jgi:hypothetical protein
MSAHPCVARIVRRIDADRVVLGPVGDVWSLLRRSASILSTRLAIALWTRFTPRRVVAANRSLAANRPRCRCSLTHRLELGLEDARCAREGSADSRVVVRVSASRRCAPSATLLSRSASSSRSACRSTAGRCRPSTCSSLCHLASSVSLGDAHFAAAHAPAHAQRRLVQGAALPRPLVIPLGLLAITIRPELLLKLEMTAAISNPISLTIGANRCRTCASACSSSPASRSSTCAAPTQTNSLVSSTRVHARRIHDAGNRWRQGRADVRRRSDAGRSSPCWRRPSRSSPSACSSSRRCRSVVPSTVEQRCTLPWGYAAQAGLQVGARCRRSPSISACASFELTFGGALPYAAEFSAIEMQPPRLHGVHRLSRRHRSAGARGVVALRGPTVMPSPLPTANNPDEDFIVTSRAA